MIGGVYFDFAMQILMTKYPDLTIKNKFDAFDIVEMIIDELNQKNGDLFFKDYFDKYPEFKDLLDFKE